MIALFKLMLPALVPSWRFFKSVQPSPRVFWQSDNGPWQAFRPSPPRVTLLEMVLRLFWNAGWNEGLYAVSLAERLNEDPTPHAEDELFRLIASQCAVGSIVSVRLIFVTRDREEITFQSAPRQIQAGDT